MRLFSKRLYHGTPHAFDKFDTEHIGTGEGAQVHGWGLYFAEDKDVAEQYKTDLASDNHQYKIEMNGKEKIVGADDEDIQLGLKDFSVPESIATSIIKIINHRNQSIYPFKSFKQALVNEISQLKVYPFNMPLRTATEAMQKFEEMLSWANEHNFDVTSVNVEGSNKLITVEIPDDLVFAEEDESIRNQPKQVVEALKQIADNVFTLIRVYQIPHNIHTNKDIETIMRKYIPSDEFRNASFDDIFNTFNDWYDNYDYDVPPDINLISNHLETIGFLWADFQFNINWKDVASELLDYANQYMHTKRVCRWDTFEEFYDDYSSVGSPKETSLKLESLGVNGIHYDGRQDGSCYVIFNPNHIKIVEVE